MATKNKIQGFTLIEAVIVVVIIGILSVIAYPTYQESVRKTRRAEGRAALMQLMQQEERYYSQSNSYIVFSSTSTDVNEVKFKWFSGDSATTSSYEISAAACDNDVVQNCVRLTAKPGTSKVNTAYTDTACGNLMLSSTGEKTVSGNAANCWQ